ncbi:MAG: cell envelope integrity EipB family protein [Hyphomicrobiaceae bacterium]
MLQTIGRRRSPALSVRLATARVAGIASLGLMVAVAAAPGAHAQDRAGHEITLAPHRAVYDIELAEARNGSNVSSMSGRMVYELAGSQCNGYTQSMRFVTRIGAQEGSSTLSDLRSSSWEDTLATAFRFSSSQYKDSKLEDATDGDARRDNINAEIKVDLTKPEKKSLTLKRGTYFPVQHSIALLAAARKGLRTFTADLYDGSEKGDKVYSTVSFIGTENPPGYNSKLPAAPTSSALDKLRSWPVSISYFELGSGKQDAIPSYELAFVYFENGVSRSLLIDYGEFSVRGTLKSIEMLPVERCPATR